MDSECGVQIQRTTSIQRFEQLARGARTLELAGHAPILSRVGRLEPGERLVPLEEGDPSSVDDADVPELAVRLQERVRASSKRRRRAGASRPAPRCSRGRSRQQRSSGRRSRRNGLQNGAERGGGGRTLYAHIERTASGARAPLKPQAAGVRFSSSEATRTERGPKHSSSGSRCVIVRPVSMMSSSSTWQGHGGWGGWRGGARAWSGGRHEPRLTTSLPRTTAGSMPVIVTAAGGTQLASPVARHRCSPRRITHPCPCSPCPRSSLLLQSRR